MDNAIEASKNSEEKEIYFEISTSSNLDIKRTIITIENSYFNKDVDLNKIYEKGYTSKTSNLDSHGLGLWEVNKIINKSQNMNLTTDKNDKFFIQKLQIYESIQ